MTASTPLPAAVTDNVVPITRRADTVPDGDGLEINHRTIPGRTPITLLTVQARHSDGSPDPAETGLLIETSGVAPITAAQARQLARLLLAAADEVGGWTE